MVSTITRAIASQDLLAIAVRQVDFFVTTFRSLYFYPGLVNNFEIISVSL